MASSISFKAYNLVYMFFRAKISTADLSIQPPIQSASLQETKNLSQVPRNKDHHSPGNLCKNRAKTCFSLPFKLVASGHYLSGETEGAGFHSCCLVFFLFFPAPTSQAAWFEALCVVLLAALTSKTSGLTALQSSKEKPCCIQQNQQSSAWCQSPGQRWSGVPDWKQQAPFGRTVKQRFLQHFWQEL